MPFFKHIKKAFLATVLLLGFGFLFWQQEDSITLKNDASDLIKKSPSEHRRFLSGLLGDEPRDAALDSTKGIFLDQREIPSQERQAIISYIAQANQAIPLTTEALRFALTEAILGQYEPLNDAIGRIQEGKKVITAMTPPLNGITFHKTSVKLLEEYERVLRIPLVVPREHFDPQQLEDDFEKLDALAMVGKHELRSLMNTYGIPLLPKVISFYEEAIGIK